MARPEAALARLAEIATATIQANTPDGKGQAFYPIPGDLTIYPSLLLFWGETTIDYAADFQIWSQQVRGQVLVSTRGKLATGVNRVDPLLAPLVDAFTAGGDGYNLIAANGERLVDFCRVDRIVPSLIIEFPSGSGIFHYGAEVWWGLKIRRAPGDS